MPIPSRVPYVVSDALDAPGFEQLQKARSRPVATPETWTSIKAKRAKVFGVTRKSLVVSSHDIARRLGVPKMVVINQVGQLCVISTTKSVDHVLWTPFKI